MTESLPLPVFPIFPLALLGLGLLLMFIGGIWFLVEGFREHVFWGLALLFIPFAHIAFLFMKWQRAKAPFLVTLLAFAAMMGGILWIPKDDLLQQATRLHSMMTPASTGNHSSAELTLAEIETQVNQLKQREISLIQKKALHQKSDAAGAAALKAEIDQYNADRQKLQSQPGYPMWKLSKEQPFPGNSPQ